MNAILKSLLTVVGIPTLLASIYYGIFASDIYVSEAKFAVRAVQGATNSTGLTALLAGTAPTSGGQDSMVVVEYSKSHDMLAGVQSEVDLLGHYSSRDIDRLSRLKKDASGQEQLDYFMDHVVLRRDIMSDVITLKVRAFDPNMAQLIAKRTIELNERVINTLSNRMEEDAMTSALREIENAEVRLRNAALAMASFRSDHDSFSPQEESSALFSRVASIEARLTDTRAQLTEKRAFMRESAPEIVSLKNRANALERQLRIEKSRATGNGEQAIGGLMTEYQPLLLEEEMARQQYASTLSSLELARLDAAQQKQYLVTFVQPSLPTEASEPRRLKKIVIIMVYSFLAYLIFGLLWAALKEHLS